MMNIRAKYKELANKWLAKNGDLRATMGDFNEVCWTVMETEGWLETPENWLAAAEIVAHGKRKPLPTEAPPPPVQLKLVPLADEPKPVEEPKAEASTVKPEPAPVEEPRPATLIKLTDQDVELPEVILIGGHISMSGPVSYQNLDEQASETEEGKIRISERERRVKRTVVDTDGYETASTLRSQLNNELRKICSTSIFGRICRLDREQVLRDFIKTARVKAYEHNTSEAGSRHKVQVALVPGFISSDAERVARGLVGELQGLFVEMQGALDSANVESIRDIAARMKELAPVFPAGQQKAINEAIKAARSSARTLVREVEKKGRMILEVKAELDTAPVSKARLQFMALPADMDADLIEEPMAATDRFEGMTTEGAVEEPGVELSARFETVNGE